MGRYVSSGCEDWTESRQALWDNAIHRATYSKRGQAVLRELEVALLALPEPRLIEGLLCDGTGVCMVGAIAAYRKVQSGISWEDAFKLLDESGVYDVENGDFGSIDLTARYGEHDLKMAFSLAWDMAFTNDEMLGHMTPEKRHERAVAWVRARLVAPQAQVTGGGE